MKTVYDFSLTDAKGNEVSLSEYKGKVLLIVNTATGCGFTPQYNELEAMYRSMRADGFEIIDIPCNQFGNQAPGTDEEIAEFCRVNFATEFPQFKKSDVNGENELPLYTWLKSQKGFEGFDKENSLTPRLESMFDKADPDWRSKSDIKWNFTKFLIDRNGNVIARFEPTKEMSKVAALVKEALDTK
ncbi:glutathione peroxidase [Bacteroides heparinolyticus]|uniref:glutathione peroxidase n=1 Tax=Prevotella heparinolytica TaxID=28113 RepID=UPI0035A0BAB9